jgi:polyhydroxyalkanoate synthesis regulator phasin
MDDAKVREVFGQMTGKTIETMTLWTETNQRVMRDLVELGANAAKEGVRLYSDLSRSALDAFRDGGETMTRWQMSWRECASDPTVWCQKAVSEGVTGAQRTVKLAEEGAQAWSRAAERVQSNLAEAGKGIQDTLVGAVSKIKEIYAGS